MLASSSKLGKLKKKIDKIKIKTDPAVKCMDDKKNENLNVSSWAQVHKVGAGSTKTTIQAN